MTHIKKLLYFVKPYWRRGLISLVFLILVIFIDLAIPRLIQRIIDQGINGGNMQVVISTTIIMLVISVLQTLFALANNLFSIQVGESVARDLREALFLKIQSFSFGNLDHLNTGQLMVRLSSDTSAFQRMVQVSLRIGTRAPLLMIGSLILMFVTDSRLALMVHARFAGDNHRHRIFRLAHGTVVHDRPEETGSAEHGLAGKHRGRAAGQGVCPRRP